MTDLQLGQTDTTNPLDDELWDGKLLKPDEYFSADICEKAIRTDGHFRGWINPDLIEKYQFELSAAEAWEKNGGGKFSYKNPLGTNAGKKKGGSGRFSAKVRKNVDPMCLGGDDSNHKGAVSSLLRR